MPTAENTSSSLFGSLCSTIVMARVITIKRPVLVIACAAAILLSLTSTAFAKDAVRIFLEKSQPTATLWPTDKTGGDYLRIRALFLDEDGAVADTFNGRRLADCTLELSSLYADAVRFALVPATSIPVPAEKWTRPDTGTLTVNLAKQLQEFSVSYDNIIILFQDIITARLVSGDSSIQGTLRLEVVPPEADCYVVRSGGLSQLPAVPEEISGPRNDKLSKKQAGDPTTIEIFSAKSIDTNGDGIDEYYFTNRLPAGAQEVTVLGTASELPDVVLAQAPVRLMNGYAKIIVQIQDLKIPELLLDAGDSSQALLDAMNRYLNNNTIPEGGVEITWSARSAVTRPTGNRRGDTGYQGLDYISVKQDALLVSESNDTSTYAPADLERVTIVGLPVNGRDRDGAVREYGFLRPDGEVPATAVDTSLALAPLDAYFLLQDAVPSPAAFTVSGTAAESYVYGAVVGYDRYGNPAPFLSDGRLAAFTFNRRILPCYAGLQPLNRLTQTITATAMYQGFLPFRKKSPTLTGNSVTALDSLFIAGSNLSSAAVFAGIDSETEGLDFIIQDGIGAVTVDNGTSIAAGQVATDSSRFQIASPGDDEGFAMRLVDASSGSPVLINNAGATTPREEVRLEKTPGSDAVSADVTFFSTISKNGKIFCLAAGHPSRAMTTAVLDAPAAVAPAPADRFRLFDISSGVDAATVVLDSEADAHMTATFQDVLTAYDAFGNPYTPAYGSTLADALLTGAVYQGVPEQPSPASIFPGASVTIERDLVAVHFTATDIQDGNTKALLELTDSSGFVARQVLMNVHSLSLPVLRDIFIPVTGLARTPVEFFFADQAGALTAPVTVTSNSQGGSIDFELTAEDGTVTQPDNADMSVTTLAPRRVFSAAPDNPRGSMRLSATSGYGDKTLDLWFSVQKPPVVESVSAVDCGFKIIISDDVAVDCSGTTVVVSDALGNTVTDSFSRSDTTYGTRASIIMQKKTPDSPGSYKLTVTPQDEAGNVGRTVVRLVQVTACADLPGACLDVEPAAGISGTTHISIIISTTSTHFDNATTNVAFSCSGVSTTAISPLSDTMLAVDIAIDDGTTDSLCDITVSADNDSITCFEAFEILPGTAVRADFQGCTEIRGAPPAQVSFTDESIGDVVAWQWDFGDGALSTEQNPVHTYQAGGSYPVSLTVTGALGGENTRTRFGCVQVGSCSMAADFTADPVSGRSPLTVQFTDMSEGPVSTYDWSFGDGGISSDQHPLHTYSRPGTYSVTLMISGSGCTDTESKTDFVTVRRRAACAIASAMAGTPDAGRQLDELRAFRDRVLRVCPEGALLTRLYYRHTGEINTILARDPALKARVARLVAGLMPCVSHLLATGTAALHQEEVRLIKQTLDAIALSGSPELKRSVTFVLGEIKNSHLPGRYGVRVIQNNEVRDLPPG